MPETLVKISHLTEHLMDILNPKHFSVVLLTTPICKPWVTVLLGTIGKNQEGGAGGWSHGLAPTLHRSLI